MGRNTMVSVLWSGTEALSERIGDLELRVGPHFKDMRKYNCWHLSWVRVELGEGSLTERRAVSEEMIVWWSAVEEDIWSSFVSTTGIHHHVKPQRTPYSYWQTSIIYENSQLNHVTWSSENITVDVKCPFDVFNLTAGAWTVIWAYCKGPELHFQLCKWKESFIYTRDGKLTFSK
jgi:hypothetical protein